MDETTIEDYVSLGCYTDNSTIGTTVNNRLVENLPTNGRNFIDLVQLVPGANPGTANSISLRTAT